MAQDFHLRCSGKREFERIFDGLHPWNVTVEIYESPVGVCPEESGSSDCNLLVLRIIPVGILVRIDHDFIGGGNEVVCPVPIRAHELGGRGQCKVGERSKRTVLGTVLVHDVGSDLERLVCAGRAMHVGTVLSPGIVF